MLATYRRLLDKARALGPVSRGAEEDLHSSRPAQGICRRRDSALIAAPDTGVSKRHSQSPDREARADIGESLACRSPAQCASTSRPAGHRMATRCIRSRRATIEPVKPNAMNGRAVFTPPVSLIAPARSARRNPSGWLAVGSLVLVVSAATAGPVRTRSAAAVEITVAGRASSNASIAASGSLVGVTWAARTPDGVTDIYATTSNDGGRTFRAPVPA